MSVGTFFLGAGAIVLLLVCVVTVHEAGHFVLGKLCGIRVDEFAIGFGPRLVSTTRGETVYSIRLIPAGGFVRMAGMLGLEGEADAGERNFYRASIPKRLATIAAGIVFNFIFAGLCFTAVLMAPTPSHIVSGAPAAAAGLQSGDTITAINGRSIRDDTPADVATDLHAATLSALGHPMMVTYTANDGSTRHTTITPELVLYNSLGGDLPVAAIIVTEVNGKPVAPGDPGAVLGGGASVRVAGFEENPDGTRGKAVSGAVSGVSTGYGSSTQVQASWLMGVQPGYGGEPVGQAALDGFNTIPRFIQGTVVGIYDLITQPKLGGVTGPNGFSGPVGIAEQTVGAAQGGFLGPGGLVYWIGFVSMNLGFVNLLPIPFLDGGKLLFIGIEAVRRRRMDPKVEAVASAVGLVVVVLFAIYVTIGDVSRSL